MQRSLARACMALGEMARQASTRRRRRRGTRWPRLLHWRALAH
jgi:hypothetical protein